MNLINLKDKVREAAKKEGFQKLRHNCAKVEVDKGHKVTSSGAQINQLLTNRQKSWYFDGNSLVDIDCARDILLIYVGRR